MLNPGSREKSGTPYLGERYMHGDWHRKIGVFKGIDSPPLIYPGPFLLMFLSQRVSRLSLVAGKQFPDRAPVTTWVECNYSGNALRGSWGRV
jgi:hypothetical protein